MFRVERSKGGSSAEPEPESEESEEDEDEEDEEDDEDETADYEDTGKLVLIDTKGMHIHGLVR